MKTAVFVLLMLLLSLVSAFAGAMITCRIMQPADEMFAMGGIIGFLIPAVCIVFADHGSR
ncbi:MAG: hypothetical protein IKS63_01715 [Firmicutes bacterium]|nr:hypothetical protein [Bacillota bacterium]